MYYFYYKKKFPKDILVYVEEVNRLENTVLIDFLDKEEYTSFLNLTDTRPAREASMILLKNYKLRNVQENTIYAVKPETFQLLFSGTDNFPESPQSALISHTINVNNTENEIFGYSVSLGGVDDIKLNFSSGTFHKDKLPASLSGEIKVTIKNVGQGSWNEFLCNEQVKLVYDIGCSMYYDRIKVRELIDSVSSIYLKCKPGLILSHWDKDHYHALLAMTDEEINSFSYFMYRANTPNNTSDTLLSRIRNILGNRRMFPVMPVNRIRRGGATRLHLMSDSNEKLLLFNSDYHKNRNISAIILAVKTSRSTVVLSADCHYEQLSDFVLPHLGFRNYHYLVVPHHGGRAGRYKYEMYHATIPQTAVISVGQNHFRHPLEEYVNLLKKDWADVFQTRFLNDITIEL